MWVARKAPITHARIARLDDRLNNGSRNTTKRWWFDLDVVDGVAVTPARGTNERDLNLKNEAREGKQKLSYLDPSLWPAPDEAGIFPIDRSVAIQFYEEAESPFAARRRLSRNGSGRDHEPAAVGADERETGA
jgi:hypothetical protein